jgi:hypothetical protein
MTSFETWGHMGVFPLTPDPTKVNAGAPAWQTFPSADDPDAPLTTLSPVTVFDAVRARPEAPVVIINHPRGGDQLLRLRRLRSRDRHGHRRRCLGHPVHAGRGLQ